MSLASLWKDQQQQLEDKSIVQIIAIAGDGKLQDDNSTSKEFREFLPLIPSKKLEQYLEECITTKFDGNGFVLQDISNEIGRRLGFSVMDGRYRGVAGKNGYDGLWMFPDGHLVVIEVKTTSVYQINLDTLAKYRRELINQGMTSDENSSILIILGREGNTSDLEAQIRGSRYAWNIRIISVDALIRLLLLKEGVDDPKIIQKISTILIPREFTKLDEIIDIVFSTAEDVKEDSPAETESISLEETDIPDKDKPVTFHEACILRIEKKIAQTLIKQSRTTYSSADGSVRITCAVSKKYEKGGHVQYWFAFHPHQKEFLSISKLGYVTFGCGAENTILLIPRVEFISWLDSMHTTTDKNRFYWHVNIMESSKGLSLYRKKGFSPIQLDKYLIDSNGENF